MNTKKQSSSLPLSELCDCWVQISAKKVFLYLSYVIAEYKWVLRNGLSYVINNTNTVFYEIFYIG